MLSTLPGIQGVLSWGKTCVARILATGPVPRHVAFVMDGNRRYARERQLETREGHSKGFESLAQILELCYDAGVEDVTVFAFSIENFKRTPREVESLMEIAKERLTQICESGELAEQYGIRIRVLGNRSLLRKDVAELFDKAQTMTKGHTRATLNICFPYTSRDDIAHGIRGVVRDAEKGLVEPCDITEQTLASHMYTGNSPPLDILIRTSGVCRFSDFMLWESHQGAHIEFVDTLWPDFGVWRMLAILLKWSWRKAYLADQAEQGNY